MTGRQPLLHDLVTCLAAPTVALSGGDGQIRDRGAHGVLHGDVRVLSLAELTVNGEEPEAIAGAPDTGPVARFVSLARGLGDPGPDPTVRIDRTRMLAGGRLTEELVITSTASVPVRAEVRLRVAADLAPIELIRSGGRTEPVGPQRLPNGTLGWSAGAVRVELAAPDADVDLDERSRTAALCWRIDIPGRGTETLRWELSIRDSGGVVIAAPERPSWSVPTLVADDPSLARLLYRSLDDLAGLRLATPDAPDDVFLAAGSPWYFTLFGRDSLWAARMLLPLGTELAAGTLRTLAARQGRRTDPVTAEAPGKIMHELRREVATHQVNRAGDNPTVLPPLYYGTIDATPLWISLLHDAWRWGMPNEQVEALLPNLAAALGWLAGDGDPDGDGFLEYRDASGTGLANQGWKDSGDAIRFADGSRAEPPVALAEAQGYAHEAALHGAALLDAFGRPGAARWRQWAADLAGAFRERFWVSDVDGRFPALALDGRKRPVDSVTSNIGHLLGTGLLDKAESKLVAGRLAGADLDSGFGLRTMSSLAGGYSTLSYHCGSVWPHDTAIVLSRLAATGYPEVAAALATGLVRAAPWFDNRMPELFAGDAAGAVPAPVPYPAACRPQAWSAASAVAILQAVLGLAADVPNGRITLNPIQPAPFGALRVSGLVAGGAELRVELDRTGAVTEASAGAGLSIVVV